MSMSDQQRKRCSIYTFTRAMKLEKRDCGRSALLPRTDLRNTSRALGLCHHR